MSAATCLVKTLPDKDARRLAEELGNWLRTAPFLNIEQYEVCADNTGLVDHSKEFRESIEPLIKGPTTAEVRITALRFRQTATIPMKAGSTVDLIPVAMTGVPSISGTPLQIGQYVHLTDESPLDLELGGMQGEMEFYCILLLAQ